MSKNKERLIAIALIVGMFLFTVSIVKTAHHRFKEAAIRIDLIEHDQYPDIPQCDKELWDRIREGCD